MVEVAPPPGWTPPAPAPAESPAVGPPPLDHVAASSDGLVLEPSDASASATFLRTWLLWGATAATTIAVVGGLCWLMLRPNSATSPVVTDSPAIATTEAAADRSAPPGPQSGGVAPPKLLTRPEAEPATKSVSKPAQKPASEPATKSPSAPVAPAVKPADKVEPSAVAGKDKEASTDAVKEQKEEAGKKSEQQKKETSAGERLKQAEFKKLAPAAVDAAKRMADPLRGIEFSDVPLARVFDVLATMSTVPITLDPDALRQVGATPHDRISLKLDTATVEQVLQAVAAQRGLAVTIDNGQVVVATPAEFRETLKTVRYTVSDLTGEEKNAVAEFAKLVQSLVAAESWKDVGGRGTITVAPGAVVVVQTGDVHRQVLVFCERLRNARHKPLRSHEAAELFSLTTRTAQARKMLDKPVTVNFHEPTTLAKILAFLAESTGSDILIDRAALALAETCDRVETSLSVQRKPLEAVLGDLLPPLGLAYRVVGPSAIQVTTKEAAEERLELEFYAAGPQAEAAKLIERIKAEVAPATWSDAGGAGEISFDAPSQSLIVLQSQPVQAAIERFLARTGD
jgi:hypothetical protein